MSPGEAKSPKPSGLRAGILLALMLLTLWLRGPLVRAQQAIQVVENSHEVQFAMSIAFHLKAQAPAGIKEVTLYYRRAGQPVTVRVPVVVEPGQTTFAYTWPLEPGDVAVGARLEYEWRIVDGEGDETRTPPVAFGYDDDRFAWKPLQDGQVLLFWYGSDEQQARRLLGYATQSLARLQGEMGATPDEPIHIYVYQSKSDMSLAIPQHSESFDDRILTLGVAADESTLLILGPHPDVEGTMAHELTHIVVGLVTHNPYAPPPRWLDEGLAMYAEGKLPAGNARALQNAVRRDALISLSSLSGYAGDPAEVDLFYGEVYSVVEFMLKTYGKDKMSQLLATFRGGLYQEQALQQVYGLGVDDLDREWRKTLGLGPRATPLPGATAVSPRRPVAPRGAPCLSVFGLGVVSLLAWARRRPHAGTG